MEEAETQEKRVGILRQHWKRILLLSLLFSVLVGSLIYVFRDILHPLRIDSVPADAYVVPWMSPSPYFEALWFMRKWDIDAVMSEALKLNITFRIDIPNGTRVIPSTVYLGHDKDYLYIGGKFVGMGKNPTTTATFTPSNYFGLLLDVANDGVLTFPESGSLLSVWVNPEADLRNETDDFRYGVVSSYEDLVWTRSGERPGQYIWLFGRDYYSPKAQPGFAVRDYDMGYDKYTETVIILFSKFLWHPATSEINALQMRRGERWVMRLFLVLGYDVWSPPYEDFVDGWPRKISSYPYMSNDSSWWPKMVIDLANPPANLTT